MRILRRRTLAVAFAAAAPIFAACGNPRTEANVAQALNDAANEISGLKNDIAQLSTEIDSLRQIVVKQDSNIARIAAANNIPISR
jgi:septal ring factor EnvC (AmiA/AmiB activator)